MNIAYKLMVSTMSLPSSNTSPRKLTWKAGKSPCSRWDTSWFFYALHCHVRFPGCKSEDRSLCRFWAQSPSTKNCPDSRFSTPRKAGEAEPKFSSCKQNPIKTNNLEYHGTFHGSWYGTWWSWYGSWYSWCVFLMFLMMLQQGGSGGLCRV